MKLGDKFLGSKGAKKQKREGKGRERRGREGKGRRGNKSVTSVQYSSLGQATGIRLSMLFVGRVVQLSPPGRGLSTFGGHSSASDANAPAAAAAATTVTVDDSPVTL